MRVTSAEDVLAAKLSESERNEMTNTFLTLCRGVQCTQCKAMSKRTRLRCRAPAIKGKALGFMVVSPLGLRLRQVGLAILRFPSRGFRAGYQAYLPA